MTVQRGAFQTEEAARVPSFFWTTSLPPACLYPVLCPRLSKYVSLCCFKPSTVLGEEHTFLSTVYNILFNPFTSPNSSPFPPSHFIGSSHSSLLPGLWTRTLISSLLLSLPRNSPQSLSYDWFLLFIKVLATQKRLPWLPKSSAHSLSHGHFPLIVVFKVSTIRKTYCLFTKDVVISYGTESGQLCIIRSLENKQVINVKWNVTEDPPTLSWRLTAL